jgi:hypothetical protein
MNPEQTAGLPPRDTQTGTLVRRLRDSSLALIVANLVPLAGVLGLDWNVSWIMLFYWSENLVIGFFNVLKMRRAEGPVGDSRMTLNDRPVVENSRRSLIFFFMVHYGGFTFCHGIFVVAMFGANLRGSPMQFGMGLLTLLLSHGVSYRRNFIGRGEYKQVSFATLFWQPYGRVVIMHLTILVGGAWAQSKGSPVYGLLVLIALKTMIDLAAHWIEHRKFQKPVPAG